VTETVINPRIPGYQIQRKLGSGGMAEVYLATQDGFDRLVALKLLSKSATNEEQFTERFYREAKNIGALHHVGITPVYEFGEHDGQLFLSMQYLDGGDLDQRIREGALPPEEALQLTSRIADALGYAHRHGVIHRDVKPENILFSSDGDVMLADFGIARQIQQETSLTRGFVIGTPPYMSPEQMAGEKLDNNSDFYSLGVVLYEMLTGEAAYRKMPVEKIFAAKLSGQQLTLPTHLASYQPLLDQILAKDRSQRHQSSEEIVAQIGALLSGSTAEPGGTRNTLTAVVLVVALAGLGLTAYRTLWVPPEQAVVTEVAVVQPAGPSVAEYHLYLDIVTGKNPELIEDFLQRFPDSPLRILVLAIGGDETTSIDQIVTAAAAGDAVAQVVMSELLDQGWLGAEQDSEQALQYATEAAASGYPFGRYVLAEQLLEKDAPLNEVTAQLQAAAEDGSYQAQNLLGSMLLGSEDPADLVQGVKWLRSGSEQGYRVATANLAVAYRDGIGVAKNVIIANELFNQAAEMGDLEVRKMLQVLRP